MDEQFNQGAPQPVMSQPQMAPQNIFEKPKKRKGLIIGIISGSLLLVALIAGLLVYFLWWQNPQKMLTDAVVNSLTTKQYVTSGTITMSMGGSSKLSIDVKGAADSPKHKADVTVKLDADGLSKQLTTKANIVLDGEKGELYVKMTDFKSSVESLVDEYITSQFGAYSVSEEYIAQVKESTMQYVDEIVDRVDNKWLKISLDDLAQDSSSACGADVVKNIQTDSVRKEIADLYAKNPFFTVTDEKVADRNGGRGFAIDLTGKNKDTAKKFAESLKNSSAGKDISNCIDELNTYDDSADQATVEDATGKLKVWIDPMSHQFKAYELEITSGDNSVKMSIDVTPGTTESIDIPSDAESLTDAIGELTQATSGGLF